MKDSFIKACLKQKPERVPVWFLRQAGRYLKEYKELREKYSMKEIIKNPSLSAKVTLMPFKYFDLDAAIIFSDLLVILWGFDIDFEFEEGIGVKVKEPYESLKNFSLLNFKFMEEEIKILKRELNVPLIGFAPSPFTLLSYLIEGKYERDFPKTRIFLYKEPLKSHLLMEKLSLSIIEFLKFQSENGCDAVMLFDSWIGSISNEIYKERVFPYVEKILKALEGKIRIYFSISSIHLIETINKYSCEVIGIDWRIPLNFAIDYLGKKHSIQVNLDPAILFSEFDLIKKELEKIEKIRKNFYGYIFNLGHGVLPETDIEILKEIIKEVHKWKI